MESRTGFIAFDRMALGQAFLAVFVRFSVQEFEPGKPCPPQIFEQISASNFFRVHCE
jgi:hypothetical protein